MIDIEDKSYKPTAAELCEYVGNSLFNGLCEQMNKSAKVLTKIEYSGEKAFLGWNVKFKKSGKTLCTVYPRRGFFNMLLVVGQKEKERVEALLPDFSEEFREVYHNTREGMGQRWMIFTFEKHTAAFDDAMKVAEIRVQK